MCNLYVNSKIMLGLLYEITAIASVGVYTPYPRKCDDQHCHQSVCGFGIMNIGRSSGCSQNVTVFVCYCCFLSKFDAAHEWGGVGVVCGWCLIKR